MTFIDLLFIIRPVNAFLSEEKRHFFLLIKFTVIHCE